MLYIYYTLACQNEDGSAGDGTRQGSCAIGQICNSDGWCNEGIPEGICVDFSIHFIITDMYIYKL